MKNGFGFTMSLAIGLALGPGRTTAYSQSNLVWNGSFEAGPAGQNQFTDWGWLGPASSFSDYGVAQSSTYPDVAEDGDYYAYFRGHPTDNSQDCLGTTVNLTQGAFYNISYYLATDGSTAGTGAAMWVVIGPSFGIDLSQDIMLTAFFPDSSNAIPYQKFTTTYYATNASPILSFHGINATNGMPATNGILLDNVSVTLTYPPLSIGFTPPNQLIFQWPTTNSPYRLEVSDSLTSTSWVTLTNVPANVGTNSQIGLSMTGDQEFYRLTLP